MKRPPTLFALLGILCLSPLVATSARSQDGPPSSTRAPQGVAVTSGTIEFTAVGWPSALTIHGKGDGLDGHVAVLGASASGTLSFDLSVLSTGIGLRDRHMKEKYLEVASHPRATLALARASIERLPARDSFDPVVVPWEGTLTLHGATRPVSGEARVARAGNAVKTVAEFAIVLGDYGIAVPSYMGITVAEKVQVKVTWTGALEAVHDAAQR
jgi:polyisoprenoid-binding protein YceI